MKKHNLTDQNQSTAITFMNGLARRVSQTFTSLTGYPPEMVANKTIEDLLLNDLKATLRKQELIKTSDKLHCFIFDRWMKPKEVDISFADGKDSGETLVSINASETVSNMEQSLREKYEKLLENEKAKNEDLKEALKKNDKYFTFIAHELKTPLAIIHSAVQAMEYLCKNNLTDQMRRLLQNINQNTHKQLRLINNILDITRLNSGGFRINWKNIDIVSLTRDITESVILYAQQKNINIEFDASVDNLVISMDENLFERILLNLLSNAIKFTPAGRQIHVFVSKTVCDSKDYASITVKDQGVGIPEDKQRIVFECFGQSDCNLARQEGGTGIGLSLVKNIVSVLNGEIFLDSKVGEGSTFKVLLPATIIRGCSACERPLGLKLTQAAAVEFNDYLS